MASLSAERGTRGRRKSEVQSPRRETAVFTGIETHGGKLTLLGREDDLVKVEGKRVALVEIAGCLESFPKVKEAEVRLDSDPVTGTVVVAKVVARSECEAEELIDHCARNLAPYKVPRRIEFCDSI